MTPSSAPALLVLHDLGAAGGRPWAEAFAGWPGAVLAPDLPGHGGAPPPVGGHHEAGDAVYAVLRLLAGRPPVDRAVVGVGRNGAAARLLALGGRASALVLVDGLGGPWLDVAGRERVTREARRRILETPEALAEPPVGASDPRAALVVGPTDRGFVVRQAEATTVPTLVVETPASVTPDPDDLTSHFPDGTLVRVADAAPAVVAAAVEEWWASRLPR